jgi:hypothetical protein
METPHREERRTRRGTIARQRFAERFEPQVTLLNCINLRALCNLWGFNKTWSVQRMFDAQYAQG